MAWTQLFTKIKILYYFLREKLRDKFTVFLSFWAQNCTKWPKNWHTTSTYRFLQIVGKGFLIFWFLLILWPLKDQNFCNFRVFWGSGSSKTAIKWPKFKKSKIPSLQFQENTHKKWFAKFQRILSCFGLKSSKLVRNFIFWENRRFIRKIRNFSTFSWITN